MFIGLGIGIPVSSLLGGGSRALRYTTTDSTVALRFDGAGTVPVVYQGANGATTTVNHASGVLVTTDLIAAGLTSPFVVLMPASVAQSASLTLMNNFLNALNGPFPNISANTALVQIYCYNNLFTGLLPSLTTNTALARLNAGGNALNGTIPSLTANTALTEFQVHVNSLTGSIPSLSANTALTTFVCFSNLLTGLIPDLSSNTAMQFFHVYSNQLTGWTGGTVSATLGSFQAQNNLLTQAAVDGLLAAFVAANRTTGTRVLSLGGTGNAAPSAAGVTNKNTLIARGWTVTTN